MRWSSSVALTHSLPPVTRRDCTSVPTVLAASRARPPPRWTPTPGRSPTKASEELDLGGARQGSWEASVPHRPRSTRRKRGLPGRSTRRRCAVQLVPVQTFSRGTHGWAQFTLSRHIVRLRVRSAKRPAPARVSSPRSSPTAKPARRPLRTRPSCRSHSLRARPSCRAVNGCRRQPRAGSSGPASSSRPPSCRQRRRTRRAPQVAVAAPRALAAGERVAEGMDPVAPAAHAEVQTDGFASSCSRRLPIYALGTLPCAGRRPVHCRAAVLGALVAISVGILRRAA